MCRKVLLIGSLLLAYIIGASQIRLPKLISDGMVLQREADLRIWGWALPGEKITLQFQKEVRHTITAENGTWNIHLPKQKAGGPYDMVIAGTNTLTVHDVLVGDVWVCSGQSNMELSMRSLTSKYGDDIAQSENKFIRQFDVPKKYFFDKEQKDLVSGSWQAADPQSILRFSAVAYYFARELYQRYKIPIGIINATLGGSRAESWMSEEALKPFANLYEDGLKFKDSLYVAKVISDDRNRAADWYSKLRTSDAGYQDPLGSWTKPDYDDSSWEEMMIPGFWTNDKLGPINGSVWYRKFFEVPSSMIGKTVKLPFGNIVDADSVFINGVFVGAMFTQYIPRSYTIPAGLLKTGKNLIAVRIVSPAGKGGFVPDKEYTIVDGTNKIDLSGMWKYRLGSEMPPLQGPTFIQWKPTGLYKGMIAPILPYVIKGVLWYQGEANVGRHLEHNTLFPALIQCWREKWNIGDFPFLWVQLPNFNEPQKEPSEGGWASFRESQTNALSVPNTGMAVTIDIGEWNDIHPINKKDVGIRLALVAQHFVYGDKKIVYSGPTYKCMKIKGKQVILSFDHIGSGMYSKGDTNLNYFSIAGKDKKFQWAKAVIKNNKIVVWSDQIDHPVAVRYAWADDPEGANLYNKEGLPARPFRTDKF